MKTIEICKIVEDALKELYVHYKIKLDKHNGQTFTVSSSFTPSEDDNSMRIDLDDGFSKYLETQYGEGDDYTELDIYLKDGVEKREDNSFDVLAFSTCGGVIDKYRSSLTPKTVEALICAHDWLRSTLVDLQDMPINGLPLE
ncbi:zinc finger BED domain-containing protein RICESLEEPER 2-like protein [Tanacetum coccineum]